MKKTLHLTKTHSQVGKTMIAFSIIALTTGCQKSQASFDPLTANPPAPVKLDLVAKAAVKINPSVPFVDPKTLLVGKTFSARPNPFELIEEEKNFDDQQAAERLLAGRSWGTNITPTLMMDEIAGPVVEPVPHWRLAGVVVGNGVIALLDTGTRVYDVRPGSRVPGTEWRVVSIDTERAVLSRDSNKLPKQFEVGLQGPIGGGSGNVPGANRATGGGGGGAGGAGGGAGGGRAGGKGGAAIGG